MINIEKITHLDECNWSVLRYTKILHANKYPLKICLCKDFFSIWWQNMLDNSLSMKRGPVFLLSVNLLLSNNWLLKSHAITKVVLMLLLLALFFKFMSKLSLIIINFCIVIVRLEILLTTSFECISLGLN